jgi:hypothetical protein
LSAPESIVTAAPPKEVESVRQNPKLMVEPDAEKSG